MPGGFPLGLDVCNGSAQGIVTASSTGTSVTAGTANTVGSWVQLTASSPSDCCWIAMWLATSVVGNGVSQAVDIGVGGAGSEVMIFQQLLVDYAATVANNAWYIFPVQIAAGTRIAARCQSSFGGDVITVSVLLFDGSFTQMEGAAGVDSIGFNASATQGTTIDPGGVANTVGSYTQLVASTARDYMGLSVFFDTLNTAPSSSSNCLCDIAIGGAGSEQVIIPSLGFRRTTSGEVSPNNHWFYPTSVPAGTRIAARAQSTNTASPARTFGCTLYGLYQ